MDKRRYRAQYERYETLADIFLKITKFFPSQNSKILIVGAGKGFEVLAFKNYFKNIVAVEPEYKDVIEEVKPYVREGNTIALEFANESFDAIYCYHVLEHIPEYKKAIFEISRVLKKGGLLYLGVPNKLRIIAYICLPDVPLKQRLRWLFADYKIKFIGKFENRFGAHAGFTKEELKHILMPAFFSVEDKTDAYYFSKYKNNILVKIIGRMQFLKEFLWPSLYFICKK
jgi:ubiquinone/menaquinone biosynthesis C-methylase UbiE